MTGLSLLPNVPEVRVLLIPPRELSTEMDNSVVYVFLVTDFWNDSGIAVEFSTAALGNRNEGN